MCRLNSIIKCALLIAFINSATSIAQDYFLNSYGELSESGLRTICFKAVNLQNATIIDSLILLNRGYIWSKTPFEYTRQNEKYFLTLSENGGYEKNSDMSQDNTYYAISKFSDNRLDHIYSDSLPETSIDLFEHFQAESGFRLRIKNVNDTSSIIPAGLYKINNAMRFSLIGNINTLSRPGQLNSIDNHEYLLKIFPSDNRNLYYSFEGSHLTICRVDNSRSRILDSLAVYDNGQLFAYHPGRDKFYRFYYNYEIHGEFPEYEKNYDENRITPEVLIYDPVSFELLESHEIADYTRGNYPGPESGPADVVGDYIVYYFFEDDWMGKFAPAMLFIFDTRTNEASWLRVGWR